MEETGASRARRCNAGTRVVVGALLLSAAMLTSGCVTAAAVGVIYLVSTAGGQTATVEVEASPPKVYAAMLKIVEADPSIHLKEKDDEKMTVSVSRAKETASGSVRRMENGHTRLVVKAKSPGGREASVDLAQRAATRVCEELGVPYKLVEK